MLNTFSVASARALESIRHLLTQEISVWRKKGVSISFSESSAGNLLIFRCEMTKPRDYSTQEVIGKIKSSIANGLSNIIVDEYEKILVAKLVDSNYAYLSGADREYLKGKVLSKLSGKDCFLLLKPESSPEPNQRKSKVWARLAEYLEGENDIVLEGFITFRLKEYLEGIFDIVDDTVEDYLTEREYREFLRLLNTFMKRQKHPASTINVLRRKDETYCILDEQLNPVGGEIGVFLEQPPESLDLGTDDLIVSAVVTLAPQQVVWHGLTNDSSCYNLLKDLFEGRMLICSGCPLDLYKE